jgi:ATP-dependent DNA helicase DinG
MNHCTTVTVNKDFCLDTVLDTYFKILQQLNAYERRHAQETMVSAVAEALAKGTSFIIEAGTGSGKSFGYLIPVLHQMQQPDADTMEPVVISTATIALQEQLMEKDIPFLTRAADMQKLNVQLVKGRGNYLCINKLNELERQIKPNSATMLHLHYLKSELEQGWNGDIAALELSIPADVWQEVRSDSDDCLGRKCRFYEENPYRKARESLEDAHILIVNHALYLQDITSAQSLLPTHHHIIFDEAHQLKHWALNAFTIRVGKFATQKLLQKIHRRLQALPDVFHQRLMDSEAALFEYLFQAERPVSRLYPSDRFILLIATHIAILQELETWIASLDMKQLPVLRPELIQSDLDLDKARVQREKLKQQLQGLITRFEFFLEADPFSKHRVNWIEVDHDRLYYEMKSTPLNIADILATQLWEEKTGILTSATMAVNNKLQFIRSDLGLTEKADELILPSPFHYRQQCVLYLPKHLPLPGSENFLPAIVQEIQAILTLSEGRAFVLFTSHGAMQQVSTALIPNLPFPCKVQGEMPRNRLIDWFKSTANSVIFATATFWEGIDIPGSALSCVIMDKIPFASPGDPVHQAMIDYIQSRGGDWFGGYSLPQATIRLKQGFGRLIRTSTDRGLVCILDPRIRQKGYGKIIQKSLPDAKSISSLDQLPDDLFALVAEHINDANVPC